MKEITIAKSEDGIRFSKYLKKIFTTMPESLLYKLFRKKYFELNGIKAKGNEILKNGDRVKIFLSDETYNKYLLKENKNTFKKDKKVDKKLIIYEDDNIILYNKPEGMLSQGADKDDISVNSILVDYIDKKDGLFNGSIVNRLDRNTRGIIIFAKTYIASREISKMIKNQDIEKHYMALVNGLVKKDKDTLEHLFKKDEKNNKAIIRETKDKLTDFSQVKLSYKVLKRNIDTTLLDINLITGKSHQIRAQLSYIGHPLVCDKKYMDIKLYKDNLSKYKRTSQDLICYKIKFGKFMYEDLAYLSNKTFCIER